MIPRMPKYVCSTCQLLAQVRATGRQNVPKFGPRSGTSGREVLDDTCVMLYYLCTRDRPKAWFLVKSQYHRDVKELG